MDLVAPPPNAVTEACIDCLALLAGVAELGWVRRAGGVTALLTKVPVATLNDVWATDGGARAAEMEAGLNEVAGQLHCATSTPE